MIWHVLVNGAPLGPVSEAELAGWFSSGRLSAGELVWTPGMPGWMPAYQTQPFARIFWPAPVAVATQPVPTYDASLRWVVPVGRSGWAVAAGYLGLCSVLLLPAPLSLAIGIIALRELKRHPTMLGKGRAIFGIVMGAVGTIALCALLLNPSL